MTSRFILKVSSVTFFEFPLSLMFCTLSCKVDSTLSVCILVIQPLSHYSFVKFSERKQWCCSFKYTQPHTQNAPFFLFFCSSTCPLTPTTNLSTHLSPSRTLPISHATQPLTQPTNAHRQLHVLRRHRHPLPWITHRFTSSNSFTKFASAICCSASIASA